MATPNPQAQRNLDNLIHRINGVSTLPHTMLQVIAVTNDPLSNIKDLTQIIQTDPSLAATILKYANSVAHGLTSRITNLQHAIGYLGTSRVRNLAISASVCNIFKRDVTIGPYHRRRLWDHMVAVAVTSRMIAERQNVPNPEDVFLAGLLHDLGIILEDQYYHEPFAELMRNFPQGKSLIQAEQEAFGFDHAVLGAIVAKQWKLPEVVQETILFHHAERYYGYYARTIACVELANVMTSAKGIRSVGIPLPGFSASAIEHLKIGKGDVKILVDEMHEHLAGNEQLFNLVSTPTRDKLASASSGPPGTSDPT